MPTTRRLAAILAADVAGYSRLMGEDEVGTAQALHEYHAAAEPLVTKHGGRVVKTIGDGVLIEFGSVVGAVECTLAPQQLAGERNAEIADKRRMEWRIGIHLGDVLVEDDDILGDGVNIAAGLEGIAELRVMCIGGGWTKPGRSSPSCARSPQWSRRAMYRFVTPRTANSTYRACAWRRVRPCDR